MDALFTPACVRAQDTFRETRDGIVCDLRPEPSFS
jgi:hypothetical protein